MKKLRERLEDICEEIGLSNEISKDLIGYVDVDAPCSVWIDSDLEGDQHQLSPRIISGLGLICMTGAFLIVKDGEPLIQFCHYGDRWHVSPADLPKDLTVEPLYYIGPHEFTPCYPEVKP